MSIFPYVILSMTGWVCFQVEVCIPVLDAISTKQNFGDQLKSGHYSLGATPKNVKLHIILNNQLNLNDSQTIAF
jgi:hypothetical protein